jgi:hypothetical protein
MLEGLKRFYKLLSPKHQKVILEYPLDLKARYSKPPHQKLLDIIKSGDSIYEDHLKEFLNHTEYLQSIKKMTNASEPQEPVWNNGYLPGMDIINLTGVLGRYRPNHYVEIGSGNSTKVARAAINHFELSTKITSIDPYPRVEIDELSDKTIRKTIDKADLSIFEQLEPNDVLFVDNSHVCFPNSDVTIFFLDILPRLKKGVVVHVHDIYIPYDYPDFMIERYYSEQYMLSTYLLFASNYQVILPNYYMSETPHLSSILDPIYDHKNLKGVERHGGSFWFVIK